MSNIGLNQFINYLFCILEWWHMSLLSISIFMSRQGREHLASHICIKILLIGNIISVKDCKKTRLHFIAVTIKAEGLLRKQIQAKKLYVCMYVCISLFIVD